MVKPLILDTGLSDCARERDPLTLHTDKRALAIDGCFELRRSLRERTPHAADTTGLFFIKRVFVGRIFIKRGGRRLLKTFAEDHLAIDPAVDLVVDIFDTGAGQVATDRMQAPAGIDVQRD